jgi:cytochrome c-type biogenesis protein CcmE
MDLTPRHEVEAPSAIRREVSATRRRVVMGVIAALILVAGFVAMQGLRNATLFFRNVDEAVAERDDLADRRFRLQGRVVPNSVRVEGGVTNFDVAHNCSVASVQHTTDPPELFQSPWIPVVLEGSWIDGEATSVAGSAEFYFVSDRMLVKHTNEYAADNVDRVETSPDEDFLEGCSFSNDESALGTTSQ